MEDIFFDWEWRLVMIMTSLNAVIVCQWLHLKMNETHRLAQSATKGLFFRSPRISLRARISDRAAGSQASVKALWSCVERPSATRALSH